MRNLKELNKLELRNINGGSELTDKFWLAVGAVIGYTKRTWEIITADPHNPRFR